ncbi:MAG: pilus assembly protein TadG-related protein [Hyphomicrobiaceae bacterium]
MGAHPRSLMIPFAGGKFMPEVRPGVPRLSHLFLRFVREDRGSVAIMFALSSLVILSLVGGAVDYGRASLARQQLQHSVDASVLAAARVWETTHDMGAAEQTAQNYFNSNQPRMLNDSTAMFSSDAAKNKLVLDGAGHIAAPFLSAAGAIGSRLFRSPSEGYSYAVSASAQAIVGIGSNAPTDLEVALMLDVTSSMTGQKLTDLKDAANDLIDILVWDDQSQYSSRVALAPFADRINVGKYAGAMTGLPLTRDLTSKTGKGKNSKTATATGHLIQCVTDRWGVAQFKDDPPDAKNFEMSPYDGRATASVDDQYQSDTGTCARPTAEIMPLTSDKEALKARVNSMTAGGSTAGALGTQMTWYLLSPNWSGIWPGESAPASYTSTRTQKIAVLMTDGEYNYHRGEKWNSASVNAFAKNTCRGMKEKGIIVFTVGFELPDGGRARDVLMDCASDQSKFYDAADGTALRAAFRDIALELARLRLTQ